MTMEQSGRPAGTVYVVDDDLAVLKATGRLLRAAGLDVRAFNSPLDFLEQYQPDVAGCLLLDLNMPGMTGIDLQEALASRDITLPIVFLSGHGDIPTSVRAVKRGAVDFLTKPVDESALLAAIGAALEKDRGARLARAGLEHIHRRIATLTPREQQVMALVVKGMLNKQIGAELGTVEKTVKVHRARVMRKMQVRSVADLVRLVERIGWTKV